MLSLNRLIKKALNWCLYFTFGSVFFFLRLLPFRLIRGLSLTFGSLAFIYLKQRREIGFQNLRAAFGSFKSDEEIKRTLKNYFLNLTSIIIESPKLVHLSLEELNSRLKIRGLENYQNAKAKGMGIIGISAHFGNFPLLMHAGSLMVSPGYFVVREDGNELAIKLLRNMVCRHGNQMIPRGRSIDTLVNILNAGEFIGLMIDQRGGKFHNLTPVNLFGRVFYLNKGPALLAKKTNAPVLPIYISRLNNSDYQIDIMEEVPLVNTNDADSDIKINMNRIISTFEQVATQWPDHWIYWAWRGFRKEFQG